MLFQAIKGVYYALWSQGYAVEFITPELLAESSERKEEWFRDAVTGQARPLPGAHPWRTTVPPLSSPGRPI